jgi:hypothetical protein
VVAQQGFGLFGFAIRWAFALLLVLGTFNPTRFSYYGWVTSTESDDGAMSIKVLVGVLLLILFIIYLRATWRSLGPIGVGLAVVLLATLTWVAIDLNVLSLEQTTTLTWIGLVVVATVMALGMSWSHVRRRLSGQADVDDLDT